MPNIRPSADVRNNYPEIAKICKTTKEPVYITVNGRGDTAIIDIGVLDELYKKVTLYEQILAGMNDLKNEKTLTHEEVFSKFNK